MELREVEINRLDSTLRVEVRVRLTRRFRLRTAVGILLMRLGLWFMPCHTDFSFEYDRGEAGP